MSDISYEYIKQHPTVKMYIKKSDETLKAIGYTEHSSAHVGIVAHNAEMILNELNYPKRTVELGKIAAHMHDIGNMVNRSNHAQSGAVIAFQILNDLRMPADEIAEIVTAIGHHDEGTALPLNPITAALIIADKTDVRRSRVRNNDLITFDIHDRVNYAAEKSSLHFNEDKSSIILEISIDTSISAVLEYFEIFLDRMLLSKRAAMYLGIKFEVIINGLAIL